MPTDAHLDAARALNESGHARVWWAALPAVPDDPDSQAYLRLRRVWLDHSLGRDRHPLTEAGHPVGMLTRLFENFRIFFPQVWLGELIRQVAWEDRFHRISTARWSYGYETVVAENGHRLTRLCDLVVHLRDSHGDAIIVGKVLPRGLGLNTSMAEHMPGSWLDLPEFAFTERRHMIYLVDETAVEQTAARIEDPVDDYDPSDPDALDHHEPARHRVLTWQDLAAIQIRLANVLPIHQVYRSFIASAIQWQFAMHDIRPSELAFDYLAGEKSFDAIFPDAPGKQTVEERREPLWKLD